MTSSRKASVGSTFISEKRISQWEDLMRNFSEKNKVQSKTGSLDIPRAQRSKKNFPTGSNYEGTWDVLGISGYGVYTFPSGIIYEGDFEDGMMHGKGELRYANGAIIRGKWDRGVITERTLFFSTGLKYKEENWKYCMMPDRRFAVEYNEGIRPAGDSYLTADQPTKEIPPGYYDCGDGFYDPLKKVVYKYTNLTAIKRSPSDLEHEWIVNECRTNEKNVGPRPDLYEEWSEPILDHEPNPLPVASSDKVSCERRQSSFEQEFLFSDDELQHFDTGSPSESSTSSED